MTDICLLPTNLLAKHVVVAALTKLYARELVCTLVARKLRNTFFSFDINYFELTPERTCGDNQSITGPFEVKGASGQIVVAPRSSSPFPVALQPKTPEANP